MKPLGVFSISCEDILSIFFRSIGQTNKQTKKIYRRIPCSSKTGKKLQRKKNPTHKDVREIFIEPYIICLDSCCCQCSTVFHSFASMTGRISRFLSSSRASNSKLPTRVSSHLALLFFPPMFLILDEKIKPIAKCLGVSPRGYT